MVSAKQKKARARFKRIAKKIKETLKGGSLDEQTEI